MASATMRRTFAVALLLLGAIGDAVAQGSAFTYQGRLNDNGIPATGIYDLRFTAYDAPANGSIAGVPLISSAAGVSNGLFTVMLDFGANVFTGPARWLEISVRTNGGASFVPLSPRQLLTPAPYAIFAATASNVVSGSVVKSVNALKDDVTLAAGANVTITPSGNTLTIASAAGGSNGLWSANGTNAHFNSGNVGIGTANPATKLSVRTTAGEYGIEHTDGARQLSTYVAGTGGWLGTRSADPLHFFVNGGAARMTVDTTGNVGIGTTGPGSRLTVSGSGAFDNPFAAAITLDNPVAEQIWEWHALDDGRLQLADRTAGATRVLVNREGNVGIGTANPLARLHVHGEQ